MSDNKGETPKNPPGRDDDEDMSVEEDNDATVAVQVAAVLGLGDQGDAAPVAVPVASAVAKDEEDDQADDDIQEEEVEVVASVVEEDEGDDDDDEPVVDAENVEAVDVPSAEQPAVVVAMDEGGDDDIPEVEAIAIVEEEPSRPEPVRSTSKSKASTKKASSKSPKRSVAAKAKPSNSNTATKKRKKSKASASKTDAKSSVLSRIDAKRLESANVAREMLYEAVPRLPFPVNDSSSDQYYVRNFGRLKVGKDDASLKFSTPTALYPVGFSCDRYEFSPSHGRILKLRCSIIDGQAIGENGPIFRVMWGQGVDDDVDKVEYPYDPFTNSAPMTSGKDDVVAVPTTSSMHQPMDQQVIPAVGMRVKARFDKNQFYHGTIEKVTERDEGTTSSKSKKKKKKTIHVTIAYDDGSTEETSFPDPDITLAMPGKLRLQWMSVCRYRRILEPSLIL